MSIPKSWNTAKAEAMWREGASGSTIAQATGAPSRSAVIAHMARNNIARPAGAGAPVNTAWSPTLEARLRTLWQEGVAPAAIATALGVTTKSVRAKAHRMGLGENHQAAAERPRPVVKAKPTPPPVEKQREPKLSVIDRESQLPGDITTLKTLLERGPRECCWPVGAPVPGRGQLYCCQPVTPGRPYCGDHTTGQPTPLKQVRLRDERVRRPRPDRDEATMDLTEMLA